MSWCTISTAKSPGTVSLPPQRALRSETLTGRFAEAAADETEALALGDRAGSSNAALVCGVHGSN